MFYNMHKSFGTPAKLLHWIMFIWICGMYAGALTMINMEVSTVKWQIYSLHKASGILFLLLFMIRIMWRLYDPAPSLPNDLSREYKFISRLGHFSLYILMALFPMSGFLMTYLGGHEINMFNIIVIGAIKTTAFKPVAGIMYKLHCICAWTMPAIVGGHILAAIYHHFVRKDNVFNRMWLNKEPSN